TGRGATVPPALSKSAQPRSRAGKWLRAKWTSNIVARILARIPAHGFVCRSRRPVQRGRAVSRATAGRLMVAPGGSWRLLAAPNRLMAAPGRTGQTRSQPRIALSALRPVDLGVPDPPRQHAPGGGM